MPISEITLTRPQPSALANPPARPMIGRHLFLLSLTSSGLLWLCYFPADCGWLIWVALVPLLALVRSPARPSPHLSQRLDRRSGLLLLAAIQWMRVADPRMYATWICLAFYCSLYFPLAVYLIRFLDRRTRWPLVLTVPLVWTALEFLRSTLMRRLRVVSARPLAAHLPAVDSNRRPDRSLRRQFPRRRRQRLPVRDSLEPAHDSYLDGRPGRPAALGTNGPARAGTGRPGRADRHDDLRLLAAGTGSPDAGTANRSRSRAISINACATPAPSRRMPPSAWAATSATWPTSPRCIGPI